MGGVRLATAQHERATHAGRDHRWLRAALMAGLLASCARYTPLPLPAGPALAPSVAALRHGAAALPASLNVADIAALVLDNNPDLLAARRQRAVAQAQLLAAGVPPNPVLAASFLPLAAGSPGSAGAAPTAHSAGVPAGSATPAYTVGLSYDIRSLLTLNHRRAGARAAARQVDAQLLWQEWQSVGQARLLAVDLMQGATGIALLTRNRDVLGARLRVTRQATAAGNATIATLAPDIAALTAAQTVLADAERQQLLHHHQLCALLGLLPDAPLPLARLPVLPALDAAAVLRDLASLAQRRPDLVALAYGFQAQDQRLRTAIIAQFPNVAIGVIGGSDNANVRNIGPQISIDVPVFDRNQGNIAIERATRLQLRDEYAARLSATDGQVRAVLSEIAQLRAQLARAQADLGPVRRMAAEAEAALRSGSLDERSAVDFLTARLNREVEVGALALLLLEQQVALETLTGAGLPPVVVQPPDGVPEEPRS